MADIATLGFQIQSEGLVEGSKALDKLTAAAKRAEDATLRMGGALSNAARRLQDGYASASRAAERIAAGSFQRMSAAARLAAQAMQTAFDQAWRYLRYAAMGIIAGIGVGLAAVVRNIRPIEGEVATLTDYLGAAWDMFATRAESALQGVVRWTLQTVARIAQLFDLAFAQVSTIWNRLPSAIGDVVVSTANRVVSTIERMVNAAIGSINAVLSLANKIPGINVGQIGQVDLGRFNNSNAGAAAGMASEMGSNYDSIMSRDYFDEWGTAANARAWSSATTTTSSKGRERANAYEQATESVNRHIEAMKLDAETYGMGTRAAETYRTQKELENAALRAGLTLTPGMRAEILALADTVGRYAEAAETATEAQRRMAELHGTLQSSFSSFASDVLKGESALRSLGSALDRIADRLLQMATDDLFNAAFGKPGSWSFGAGSGGASGGLLGGALISGILHDGGVVGSGNYPHRAVSASVFATARRYHNGGIAGLKPNEVPAILERGEVVLPKGATQGRSGDTVTINMQQDFRGVDPSMRAWIESRLAIVKQEAVQEAVGAVVKTRSLNPRYGAGVF